VLAEWQNDLSEASEYFKMSVDQGFVSAEVNYGVCLLEGLSVTVDEVKAVQYLKAAAKQGDIYDEVNYGICLLEGRGVPVDHAKVIQLFQRSADQRNSIAKVNLVSCFHEGLGASRDYPVLPYVRGFTFVSLCNGPSKPCVDLSFECLSIGPR
jgi:TPR repeat protein